MKKMFAAFCLMMLMTAPAFAKDVYIATEEVGSGSKVHIYAMDDTISVRGNVYGVNIKMVFPDGNWSKESARYERTSGGWKARVGKSNYGYVVSWPDYVSAIFDWLMGKAMR